MGCQELKQIWIRKGREQPESPSVLPGKLGRAGEGGAFGLRLEVDWT